MAAVRRGLRANAPFGRANTENASVAPVPGKSVVTATAAATGKLTKAGGESRTAFADISNVNRKAHGVVVKKEGTKLPVPEKRVISRQKSTTDLARPATRGTNLVDQQKKLKKILVEQPMVVEDIDEEVNVASDMLDELDIDDIDRDDCLNPLLCSEYVKDIYAYMHTLELDLQTDDYFAHGQTEVTVKMRAILVDWLIQVQMRFNLLQETLYLTVYVLDRFLATTDVCKKELQLVGVTAMLLASKYEEMYAPEIGDFVYITDNAYSKGRIRSMEQTMLKALQFDLSNPSCLHFLRRNSKAGEVNATKHTLAKYLMELTLVDFELARTLPSEIAAAALCLAMKLVDDSEWTPLLAHYSGYSERAMQKTVRKIARQAVMVETHGCKYEAAKNKYAASKYMKISRIGEMRGECIKKLASEAT